MIPPSKTPSGPTPNPLGDNLADALAIRAPDPAPPAPQRLAASLDEADHRSLIHLDDRGQVRSPTRYRVMNALGIAYGGLIAGAGSLFYAGLFGPVWGLAAGVVFGCALAVGIERRRRMRRVAELIADGRLAEAEQHCQRVIARRFVPRALKAAAHHNLAIIASRRGNFMLALEQVRASAKLRQSGLRLSRKSLYVDLLAYAEIGLLVNLGRTGEARARLEARGPAPQGDFLRLLHTGAELSVQFAENRLTLDDDDLWDRSRRALRLHSAPHLLALCAWAHATRQNEASLEMSDHLLGEAIERATPESPITFPTLWAWVESRRPRLAPLP